MKWSSIFSDDVHPGWRIFGGVVFLVIICICGAALWAGLQIQPNLVVVPPSDAQLRDLYTQNKAVLNKIKDAAVADPRPEFDATADSPRIGVLLNQVKASALTKNHSEITIKMCELQGLRHYGYKGLLYKPTLFFNDEQSLCATTEKPMARPRHQLVKIDHDWYIILHAT